MVELEASVQRQTLKMMDNMLKKMGVDAAIEVGQVGAGLALPVAVLAIGLFTWALTWSSHSVLVTLLQHTQSGDSLYMGLGVSMAFTLAFVMGHAMAALWFFRHALAAVDSAIASHRERAAKARAIMQASGVGGTDGLVDETGAHLPTRKLQDGDEIFIISRLDTKLMVFTDGTIRATGEVAYNAEHNDVVFIVYMDHNGRVALQAKGTEKFISMSSASLRCAKDIPGPSGALLVYVPPGNLTPASQTTARWITLDRARLPSRPWRRAATCHARMTPLFAPTRGNPAITKSSRTSSWTRTSQHRRRWQPRRARRSCLAAAM